MLAERLTRQLLSGAPARDPVAVVERLLAVQAQDPRGFRLAVRARSAGLVAADVERRLADRSLIVTWLNRGTLHLVRGEDYPWLQALTTPQLASGNTRRLAQEGVSPDDADRGVDAVVRSLEGGPMTRAQLGERVSSAGVRIAGQALVHILFRASLRGLVVRGPVLGAHHAFVLTADWLPPSPPPRREQALAELARRYLAGHGPATERDLAKWAGVTLGDARAGLRSIGAEIVERDGGLVDLAGAPGAEPLPPPRLLGPYDPLLCGWVSRADVLDGHSHLVTVNGLFRPFALVRGKAVATWGMSGGRVELSPFRRLAAVDRTALDREAREVERFLAS